MSSYKSQLKGWAVDRVIEAHKAGIQLTDLQSQADALAAYAYEAKEDLDKTAGLLFDLTRNADAGESKITAIIGTLERIMADRIKDGLEKLEEETIQ